MVGRRTFGKGLVQRPLTFDDGSEIRLTIAHYYTPSGRCIQKPYKKGDRLDYAMDLDKRYKHGEFTNQDSIHLSDSLKYYTLRKHRVVYGGGGIMPDYFVPLDTTKYTKMYRQLEECENIVINHSLKFIDAHRKELKSQYKDFDKFLATYEVPSSLIDGIIAEGKKEKIEPKDEAELIQTKKYLRPAAESPCCKRYLGYEPILPGLERDQRDSSASRAAADYGEVTIEKTAVNC